MCAVGCVAVHGAVGGVFRDLRDDRHPWTVPTDHRCRSRGRHDRTVPTDLDTVLIEVDTIETKVRVDPGERVCRLAACEVEASDVC